MAMASRRCAIHFQSTRAHDSSGGRLADPASEGCNERQDMKQDMKIDIVRALDPLVRYRPMEELLHRLELPMKLLPEPVTNVVPTVVVSADGLSLESVVLASASLLCEVRLKTPHHNFDFVQKKVSNYRVRTWEQELKEGDTVKQR